MDYFDTLTEQRIDSETADLVDRLVERYSPLLAPCQTEPRAVFDRIRETYPLHMLPPDSIHFARTALSAVETHFPDDAAYLPADFDERLNAAANLARALHLDICCAEIADEGSGHALYVQQREQFETRAAAFGLTWTPMPVRVCMEYRSGYCLITGSDTLSNRVTLWRGVSQEDIDRRTPGLIAYLRAKYAAEDA